jgi:hypothetical protein
MKHLIIYLLFFICHSAFTQVLKTTNLNLNPGAKVFDVEHIPGLNAYVLVGNFNTIGGLNRNKLALIDDQTFQVKTDVAIFNNTLSFDGTIRSVEYAKVGTTNYLVLGGDFHSINGVEKQGMALLTTTGNLSPTSNFTLFNWDYATTNGTGGIGSGTFGNGVFDLLFVGDTLYVGGSIDGIDLSNGTDHDLWNAPDVQGYCFFALKANPAQPAKFSIINSSTSNSGITSGISSTWKAVFSIRKIGNHIFISGGSNLLNNNYFFQKRNLNLTIDNSFNPSNTLTHFYSSIENLNDSIFTAIQKSGGAGEENMAIYRRNGAVSYGYSNYNVSQPTNLVNKIVGNHTYNSDLLVFKIFHWGDIGGERNVLKRYAFDGISSPSYLSFSPKGSENLILPNVASVDDFEMDTLNNIFIQRNKLFLSAKGITGVNGSARTGLAVFCLEPEDPKPFINPDLTICSGNEIVYSIPPSKMVDGYRWSYSGSGAKYRVAGTSNAFQPLTGNQFITDVNAGHAIEIQFQQGVTAGVLTVTPFATCNSSTDYVFARDRSINLQLVTPPVMSMVDTLNFTCYSDTVHLTISTPEASPAYSWSFQNAPITGNINDTLSINKFDNTISGYYYGFVQEPINMCKSMDSTYVSFDTIAPAIPLNSYQQTPPVFNCYSNQVALDLAIPSATISWAVHPDSVLLASPLVLYSFDTTTVYGIAKYTSNGCVAKQQFDIQINNQQVNATLNGLPISGLPLVFDTLNCANPNLNMVCGIASGANGTAEWLINGTLSGNMLQLTSADTVGMNQQFHTKTYVFRALNNDNGCYNDFNVTVFFDFEKPFVPPFSDQSLNCSQSFVDMTHPLNGGSNITEGWLNAGNNQTGNNTLTANSTGIYYYQVENTLNGCINTDTVQVIQSNELLLDLISDTMVCQGQTVQLSVANINNNEPTTYQWSDGTVGTIANATGGIDIQLSVIAQNQSGCTGYDTVTITVPSPVVASFIVNATCTEAAIQIASISGGTGNYQYALNNGSWQTATVFNNLNFGTHTISVKDDLGCIYEFQQIADGSAVSPDINFLVSTYNLEGDTLAIVNISNFTGFDSLHWELPPNATIHSSDDSVLIVSISSGGWYDVTLTGYIDTCSYSFTKAVYFGTEKPDFNVDYNAKGIKNLNIYPNPTTGLFTITFELGINQNYSIVVTNVQGQLVNGMQVSGSGTQVEHQMNFPAGLPTGNYRIHIVSDFDAKQAAILLID